MFNFTNEADSMTRFIPALRSALYRGFVTVRQCDVVRVDENGKHHHFKREMVERGDAAAALIYDPSEDTVLLVREFRIGNVGARLPDELWCDVGPVAGMISADDGPHETVIREISEEAGVDASRFAVLSSFTVLPSPGGCSETVALVLMAGSLKGLGTADFGVAEENEFTVREIWKREDAMKLLTRGHAVNGNLATLLLMLERERNSGVLTPPSKITQET